MSNQYDDGFLVLKGHLLNQFDAGRELAAWIDLLHPKPLSVGFQDRAILSRMIAWVANAEAAPTSISIASNDLSLAAPMLWGIFGERLAQTSLFTVPFRQALKQSRLPQALVDSRVFETCASADEVIAHSVRSLAGRRVFLVDADKDSLCRKLIDYATEAKGCHVLIRNYAKTGVVNHYGYARDKGLRILENADGSGELFFI